MTKIHVKFFNFCKKFFSQSIATNKQELKLVAIKQVDKSILCEFSDLLSIHGKSILMPIEKIKKNSNIKHSISKNDLFIIGQFYNDYEKSFLIYRMKSLDLVHQKVTIENVRDKLTLKLTELFEDYDLMKQIYQPDLLKIIAPHSFASGYNMKNRIITDGHEEKCQNENRQGNNILYFDHRKKE